MMCRALGTNKLFMSPFQGFKWNFPPAVLMQPWLWSHSGGYKNVLEQKRNNLFSPFSLLFEKTWIVLHFGMIIATDCGEWIVCDLLPGFFSFCYLFVSTTGVADGPQPQTKMMLPCIWNGSESRPEQEGWSQHLSGGSVTKYVYLLLLCHPK